MIGVFIIPTGIGAEIGGHSGDGSAAAKLISSVCDKLIIHPNVVNAADINSMTENMIYVEGSILDKFLNGHIGLQESRGNKILLVVNKITSDIVNAASAARATIGADIEILQLTAPLKMIASVNPTTKIASGEIHNVDIAIRQIQQYNADVVVVNTPIETNDGEVRDYLTKDGGTNIWGGVEAKLSKIMSEALHKPVIHAPTEASEIFKTFNGVVDPRKAAEVVSCCYVHCCLQGAHVSPIMSLSNQAYWNVDINFLISPINVFGVPHKACVTHKIPIIVVKENKTVLNDSMPDDVIIANNYLEAAGIIMAMKTGITLESVRRPLPKTRIHKI